MSWFNVGVAAIGAGSSLWAANENRDASGDAIDAQVQQNREKQAFIEQQARQTRRDALPLYDAGRASMRRNTQGAMDILSGGLRQQIDTLARGNYFAQDMLAGALPQMQNAILGLPTDNSFATPRILHPERNLDWLFEYQVPRRAGTDDLRGYLAEANALRFTPGETTNQSLVDQALSEGYLSGDEYRFLQDNMAGAGNAQSTYWGNAGSADTLLNALGTNSPLGPDNRVPFVNLFNAMYPV